MPGAELHELLPSILPQLGADNMDQLRKLAQNFPQAGGMARGPPGGVGTIEEEDEDDGALLPTQNRVLSLQEEAAHGGWHTLPWVRDCVAWLRGRCRGRRMRGNGAVLLEVPCPHKETQRWAGAAQSPRSVECPLLYSGEINTPAC